MTSIIRVTALAFGFFFGWVCAAQAQSVDATRDFSATPTSFAAGSTVDFTYTVSAIPTPGYEASIWGLTVGVDFGDGSPLAGFAVPILLPSSYTFSFQHTYDTPGVYQLFAEFFPEGGVILTGPSDYEKFFSWELIFATGAYIDVLTLNVTTAIPEPETYAMLLAGLVLLGFATRRRGRLRAAA